MKIKTIIVDDNKQILDSLIKHLEQIEFIELLHATLDSEDFLETVLEKSPDLVIMDIDMPRITGIELGKILREKLPYLEIVYVTSHGEYIKEAFEVYASDFLEKPYDLERLKGTLERIAKKFNIVEEVLKLKHKRIFDIFEFPKSFILKRSKENLFFIQKLKLLKRIMHSTI